MNSTIKAWLLGMACVASFAHADSKFSVSPGTWVVTSEVNGLQGRGMGLEVKDGILVMSVYNYAPDGKATFHLTVGQMAGDNYTGELHNYKGGRYFGGPALDGVDNGSVGPVKINFSSGTTGTIQFPGEGPLPISRYMFDGLQPGEVLRKSSGEAYMLTQLNSTNQPVSGGALTLNNTDERGLRSDYGPCKVVGTVVTCDIPWEFGKSDATITFQKFGRQLEGTYQEKGSSSTSRLIGTRLFSSPVPATPNTALFDTPTGGWVTEGWAGFHTPEAGLWGITSELTGKPGRGMVMDLQGGTLFMQMYGYEMDGSPTFRIGMGSYQQGTSTLPMQKVSGGRYFGGSALSGTVDGIDGNAQVRFTSATTGQIKLPGEDWASMQKLMVGAVAPDPASLLGKWLTLDVFGFAGQVSLIDELTTIKNGQAQNASGSTKCWFETTPQGTVRCQRFMSEYRFTPAYGVGATAASTMEMKSNGVPTDRVKKTLVLVQRVVDGEGVVSGTKPN